MMSKGPLFECVMDTLQEEELSLWDLVLTDPEKFAYFEAVTDAWETDDANWITRIVSQMLASYDTKE